MINDKRGQARTDKRRLGRGSEKEGYNVGFGGRRGLLFGSRRGLNRNRNRNRFAAWGDRAACPEVDSTV